MDLFNVDGGGIRLTGFAEGLLAEVQLMGPECNPSEPETLSVIGYLGHVANGDKIRHDQTPNGRRELGLQD